MAKNSYFKENVVTKKVGVMKREIEQYLKICKGYK